MGTNTANRALVEPTPGGDVGSWDTELNNTITFLDQILGATVTVNCAGNLDVQLTAAQSQNFCINCTGILTGNINLLIPQPGTYLIKNNTTGAFMLTAKVTAGGTGAAIPQGSALDIFSDGNTVYAPAATVTPVSPYWCGTSTGAPNQQLLTPIGVSLTALTAGNIFVAISGLTNTTAMTVGVSGTGGFQPAVRRTATGPQPFAGGEVVIGNAYQWLWDGGQFQLMD